MKMIPLARISPPESRAMEPEILLFSWEPVFKVNDSCSRFVQESDERRKDVLCEIVHRVKETFLGNREVEVLASIFLGRQDPAFELFAVVSFLSCSSSHLATCGERQLARATSSLRYAQNDFLRLNETELHIRWQENDIAVDPG